MIWHAMALFLGFLLGLFVAALLSAGARSDLEDAEALTGSLPDWGRVRFCSCGGATVVEDLSRVALSDWPVEQLDLYGAEVIQDQCATSNSGDYPGARRSPAAALLRARPRLDA